MYSGASACSVMVGVTVAGMLYPLLPGRRHGPDGTHPAGQLGE